jgi:hypothetical protein
MTIRIQRNEAGNCINFHGTTNPSYWNTCLHAEVDSELTDRVNIINDIRTVDASAPVYEFYKIPYTTFTDADGSFFDNAADAAQYITDNANVLGTTGGKAFDANDSISFSRDATDTTILVSNGNAFGVNSIQAVADGQGTITIKEHGNYSDAANIYLKINHSNVSINGALVGGNLQTVINRLNALFTVNPIGGGDYNLPESIVSGTSSVTLSSNGAADPIGDPIFADDQTATGFGQVWSTEFIRNPGEYFLVNHTGKGRILIGLYEDGVDDPDQSTTNLHLGKMWSQAFYNYGTYQGPWTMYGRRVGFSYGPGWNGSDQNEWYRFNTTVQDNLVNGNPVAMKIGITVDGYIGLWYYDDGRSNDWIMISRSSYTLTEGNYGLVVQFGDGICKLYDTPTRAAVDPESPAPTVYFIESPDGSFYYPLYNNVADASSADVDFGGSGAYTSQVFVDEPTTSTWYMPVSGSYSDASAAPVNTSAVTYVEISTNADNLYAPASLTINDLTVDEGAAVNYQIVPQDVIATVIGLPTGLTYNNGFVVGTAPDVSGYTTTNATDTYTVSATRANNYGSTTDTFDIVVTNLTQEPTAVTGFTHVSGTALIDTSSLDDGSVVAIDDTLDTPKRIYILEAWVEEHVLPNLTEANDTIYLGVSGSSAAFGSAEDADFDAFIKWQWQSSNSHTSTIKSGADSNTITVNSLTDAFYDYAFESDGESLHIISCNVNQINTEPGVENGGAFSRTVTGANTGSPFTLLFATNGTTMTVADDSNLAEISIPLGSNDFSVVETSETAATFDGSAITALTLNAGYTYRFMLNDSSIESGDTLTFETLDGTAYTSGVSTVGSHGDYLYYIQFAVPTDVPPIQVKWNSTVQGAPTISGSTYAVGVSGITQEGPAANQTGTNVMDQYDHGWISLDEQLSAGERLVMDNAFWTDFLAELNESTNMFAIGLKGDNWTNTKEVNSTGAASTGEFFKGDTYIVGQVGSGNYIYFRIYSNGVAGNQMLVNTTALHSTVCAFLEITSSGDNIRAAFGRNGDFSVAQGDESTVAYADWSSYKGQTGDQGYGITSKDVVVSFWTYSGGAIDGDNIDWTGLSEVSVPTQAATLTTPWTKALHFAGGSERTQQVTNDNNRCPLRMSGGNNNTAAPTTAGNTSNDTNARPWATSIVFKADTYNDNQHIWNLGEGAGNVDDNIYLRRDANRNLWFGWGRTGELNECKVGYIGGNISGWWGVYIASNGTRLGSGHTAADIAAAFDIRMVNLQTGATGSNLSTATNWTAGSFGARMNRQFTGDMTIGGRGSNRSFHGKVAAMVVTTLRRNVAMPTDAEISMMVRDPQQWMTDYKVGNNFRLPWEGTDAGFNWSKNDGSASYSTQVWLMGDGTNDAYAQIRNNVWPSTQNYTPMNMMSMVSNDIETVSINGLT